MTNIILSFNWIGFILVFFTVFLVKNDRAFSKKIRIEFQCSLIFCVILSLLSQHLSFNNVSKGGFTENLVFTAEELLRPVIIMLLIMVSEVWSKLNKALIGILVLVDIVFIITGYGLVCDILFVAFTALLVITVFSNLKRGDRADMALGVSLFFIIFFSVLSEIILSDLNIVNNALCVFTCVYYYYFVMRTYKKDKLTGLLLRHNLTFEMSDLIGKTYDLVLIDVDNFKLINDKYGHDRGDEVLVTIVDTVKKHLPKGARMYRFGGDEFIILSRKYEKYDIGDIMEQANSELSKKDLRISYGVVRHNPGDDNAAALVEADKKMYENKRLLKSEDIWDAMTGLYNYRGFLDELETMRKSVKNNNKVMCLVGVDVDRLNSINMAYGYTEGNLVIATLARILKKCLRGSDFIGHLGSDEFVVAIECQVMDDIYVDSFINQIQDEMDSAYELADKEYTIKLNAAKYFVDKVDESSPEDNVNNVLYIKQEDKDNRRKTDSGDNDQDYNDEDEKLVMDILDNNKLKYAFQPIVSAKDGSIVAYESLMRSDTETMVSPLKILKYAERNKRSYDVERLTFFNVLTRVYEKKEVPENARIFINSIPGFFLNDMDYDLLKLKFGSLFERMVIEITEQREIEDEALVSLNTKRAHDGFNIAIDDYGSGCSNTNSLLRYMPQVVKLDRLLITGIDKNAKKQFFVNSIISFARENDMMILAEGVETESELKTVIRLGVDMIQGYVTSRPSVDIITEIPENIKKIIIDENLKVGSNQRMVYTASSSCELSVMHLAMEDYSKLNISGEFVTLNGSDEYTADMVIRIKDNVNCQLTLSDVHLNSVDDEPCIDIGEGSNLTLNLEGNNRLNAKGIHVPEGSSLTVIGTGNIEIYVKGHECYAIGSDTESEFGKITLKGSGNFDINVDGEECVGIGGGVSSENSPIEILAGRILLNVAGVHAVGIGTYSGDTKINFTNMELISDFRVNSGIVVGSMNGNQDITVRNFNIEISGSGTEISGIGTVNKAVGKVDISAGTFKAKMNGQRIYLLGSKEAEDYVIDIDHTRMDIMGEGDYVLGIGSRDENAFVKIEECSMELIINASSPLGFGSRENAIHFPGPLATININGTLQEI